MATTQTAIASGLVPNDKDRVCWVKLDFVLNGLPGRLASNRSEIIDGVVNPIRLIQYNADPLRGWSRVRLPRSGKTAELPNKALRFHHDQDEARAARGILERVKAEIHAQELRQSKTQPKKSAYHNHNGGQRSRAIAARGRPR